MSFKQALKDFFDPRKKIKVPGMTENFYPTQDCDGCGICAKKCPTGHIKMIDGRPDWGKPCLMCAQCGDVCPKGAIAFGKREV
ncbi:MAG: 4Fe-4S binding protein [Lachnospiraceae bacterium]|nr:4Fe-4S binding protein [Lachnospiraceae bacterium]